MKSYIVKGYKGIMDLDLTQVDSRYHEEMIKVHKQDINDYKAYQKTLPEKVQYDCAMIRAYSIIKKTQEMNAKSIKN